MNLPNILGGVADTGKRLEKYLNFTALCQGVIAGVLVLGFLASLAKRK